MRKGRTALRSGHAVSGQSGDGRIVYGLTIRSESRSAPVRTPLGRSLRTIIRPAPALGSCRGLFIPTKSCNALAKPLVRRKEFRHHGRHRALLGQQHQYSLGRIPIAAEVEKITPSNYGLLGRATEPLYAVLKIDAA